MDQTRFLQRVRMNQFKRVYDRWKHKKVTQKEAAEQLGITERTFRRYVVRYRDEGTEGLLDRRLGKVIPQAGSTAGDLGVGGAVQGSLSATQHSSLLRSLHRAPRRQAFLQLDFLCFQTVKVSNVKQF